MYITNDSGGVATVTVTDLASPDHPLVADVPLAAAGTISMVDDHGVRMEGGISIAASVPGVIIRMVYHGVN